MHYKSTLTKWPCWTGHLVLTEQIGLNRVSTGQSETRLMRWSGPTRKLLLEALAVSASAPCEHRALPDEPPLKENAEGSPSLSSQGNSRFEWGLADSFKKGNPGTWTRLPTRPTPGFISTTSKQGADMSPHRASHWWGWHWKIPAGVCLPRSIRSTRAHRTARRALLRHGYSGFWRCAHKAMEMVNGGVIMKLSAHKHNTACAWFD